MVTQDLHFALARPTLRDCVHLKKNEREGKKKKTNKLKLILSWAKILKRVTFIAERWIVMKVQGHGASL